MAHRVGKPSEGDRPRPGLKKLLRFQDREDILRRATFLKGTQIFMNEDYTDVVSRKRRDLMPQFKAAREREGTLQNDKLVIYPRTSTPKPPQ